MDTTPSRAENRRSSRRYEVDSSHPDWSLQSSLTVRVVDIALGGALVASSRAFDVGESFSLRLVLKKRPCVVRGTVVRVVPQDPPPASGEEWLIGVSFTEWDRDGRDRLREFLTRSS